MAKKIKTVTQTELSKHSDKKSCWMAIEGKVYDVTDYIDKHPGGEEHMLRGCGRDMTKSFQDKRKRGIFTKESEEEIQKYFVGEFKAQ